MAYSRYEEELAERYEGIAAAPLSVSCENHMIVFAAEEARLFGERLPGE